MEDCDNSESDEFEPSRLAYLLKNTPKHNTLGNKATHKLSANGPSRMTGSKSGQATFASTTSKTSQNNSDSSNQKSVTNPYKKIRTFFGVGVKTAKRTDQNSSENVEQNTNLDPTQTSSTSKSILCTHCDQTFADISVLTEHLYMVIEENRNSENEITSDKSLEGGNEDVRSSDAEHLSSNNEEIDEEYQKIEELEDLPAVHLTSPKSIPQRKYNVKYLCKICNILIQSRYHCRQHRWEFHPERKRQNIYATVSEPVDNQQSKASKAIPVVKIEGLNKIIVPNKLTQKTSLPLHKSQTSKRSTHGQSSSRKQKAGQHVNSNSNDQSTHKHSTAKQTTTQKKTSHYMCVKCSKVVKRHDRNKHWKRDHPNTEKKKNSFVAVHIPVCEKKPNAGKVSQKVMESTRKRKSNETRDDQVKQRRMSQTSRPKHGKDTQESGKTTNDLQSDFQTIYKCGRCLFHFISTKTLSVHFNSCEAQRNLNSVNCGKCGLLFTPSELINHTIRDHGDKKFSKFDVKEVHPTNPPALQDEWDDKVNLYKCSVCSLHFVSEISLRSHFYRKIHNQTRTICVLCQYWFTQTSLNHHQMLHHNEMSLSRKDFNVIVRNFDKNGETNQKTVETSENENEETRDVSSDIEEENETSESEYEIEETRDVSSDSEEENETSESENEIEETRDVSSDIEEESETESENEETGDVSSDIEEENETSESENVIEETRDVSSDIEEESETESENEETRDVSSDSEEENETLESENEIEEGDSDQEEEWAPSHKGKKLPPATKSNDSQQHPEIPLEASLTAALRQVKGVELNPNVKYNIFKCALCSLHFTAIKTLNRHLSEATHYTDVRLMCDICNFEFLDRFLVQHIKIHHEELQLTVEDYNIISLSKPVKISDNTLRTEITQPSTDNIEPKKHIPPSTSEGRRHVEEHKKLYKCTICKIHFMERARWHAHMINNKSHSPKAIKKCSICHLAFTKVSLLRHVKLHHTLFKMNREDFVIIINKRKIQNDPKNAEETREQTEETSSEVAQQIAIASVNANLSNNDFDPNENIIYKCGECDVYFMKECVLSEHTNKHTALDSLDYINCPECGLQFDNYSLGEHRKRHHDKATNLQACVKTYQPLSILRNELIDDIPGATENLDSSEETIMRPEAELVTNNLHQVITIKQIIIIDKIIHEVELQNDENVELHAATYKEKRSAGVTNDIYSNKICTVAEIHHNYHEHTDTTEKQTVQSTQTSNNTVIDIQRAIEIQSVENVNAMNEIAIQAKDSTTSVLKVTSENQEIMGAVQETTSLTQQNTQASIELSSPNETISREQSQNSDTIDDTEDIILEDIDESKDEIQNVQCTETIENKTVDETEDTKIEDEDTMCWWNEQVKIISSEDDHNVRLESEIKRELIEGVVEGITDQEDSQNLAEVEYSGKNTTVNQSTLALANDETVTNDFNADLLAEGSIESGNVLEDLNKTNGKDNGEIRSNKIHHVREVNNCKNRASVIVARCSRSPSPVKSISDDLVIMTKICETIQDENTEVLYAQTNDNHSQTAKQCDTLSISKESDPGSHLDNNKQILSNNIVVMNEENSDLRDTCNTNFSATQNIILEHPMHYSENKETEPETINELDSNETQHELKVITEKENAKETKIDSLEEGKIATNDLYLTNKDTNEENPKNNARNSESKTMETEGTKSHHHTQQSLPVDTPSETLNQVKKSALVICDTNTNEFQPIKNNEQVNETAPNHALSIQRPLENLPGNWEAETRNENRHHISTEANEIVQIQCNIVDGEENTKSVHFAEQESDRDSTEPYGLNSQDNQNRFMEYIPKSLLVEIRDKVSSLTINNAQPTDINVDTTEDDNDKQDEIIDRVDIVVETSKSTGLNHICEVNEKANENIHEQPNPIEESDSHRKDTATSLDKNEIVHTDNTKPNVTAEQRKNTDDLYFTKSPEVSFNVKEGFQLVDEGIEISDDEEDDDVIYVSTSIENPQIFFIDDSDDEEDKNAGNGRRNTNITVPQPIILHVSDGESSNTDGVTVKKEKIKYEQSDIRKYIRCAGTNPERDNSQDSVEEIIRNVKIEYLKR